MKTLAQIILVALLLCETSCSSIVLDVKFGRGTANAQIYAGAVVVAAVGYYVFNRKPMPMPPITAKESKDANREIHLEETLK